MMGKVTPRQHLRCRAPRHSLFPTGWVAERLKAAVLKTAVRGSVPWVRIPPHPPRDRHKRLLLFVSWLTTEVQSNLYPQRRFAWSVRGGQPSRGYHGYRWGLNPTRDPKPIARPLIALGNIQSRKPGPANLWLDASYVACCTGVRRSAASHDRLPRGRVRLRRINHST